MGVEGSTYQVVAVVDAVLQPGVDCFGHLVFDAHLPAIGDGDLNFGEEVGEGTERVEGVVEHGEGEGSLEGFGSVDVARDGLPLCVLFWRQLRDLVTSCLVPLKKPAVSHMPPRYSPSISTMPLLPLLPLSLLLLLLLFWCYLNLPRQGWCARRSRSA